MKLDKMHILAGVALVVSLGLLAASLWPRSKSSAGQDGVWFVCPNGHHFHMTVGQLSDYYKNHYGQPIRCPICGASHCLRVRKNPKTGQFEAPTKPQEGVRTPGHAPVAPPSRSPAANR